jgi:hypothetical protein
MEFSARPITLAFERCGPLVMLPVRVNGSRALAFELDSGFESSVIDPQAAAALQLPLEDTHREEAPGGSTEVSTVRAVSLALPGVTLPAATLQAVPLRQFEPFFGHALDGILGYDFFERFVVAVDYAARQITLHDPAAFAYTGPGEVLPIDLSSRQPYLQAEVVRRDGRAVAGRFEVDTGSMDALGLNSPFVAAQALLEPGQPVFELRGISLGGEGLGRVARMPALRLGGLRIERPIGAIATDAVERAGQIGGEILRRFTVIFDYAREQLVLEPNGEFGEPYEFDHSGTLLVAEPPDFRALAVKWVLAGTPAAEAGLQAGDELVALDGERVESLGLDAVRARLREGERVWRLALRRGGVDATVELRLRRLI